jgi:hypothetical protein
LRAVGSIHCGQRWISPHNRAFTFRQRFDQLDSPVKLARQQLEPLLSGVYVVTAVTGQQT